MPKSGSRRKKTRTHVDDPKKMEELENAPKSFILKRGKVGLYMKELLKNMRELMYPYTAMKLKESKKNSLKDFLGAAGQFGVSHMMVMTQTENGNYLRLIKNPKGPTICLKIQQYSLSKDVQSYQQDKRRNFKIFSKTLQAPPLLIMNGFGGREDQDPHKLLSLMIQSMFPPIKVQSMNLSTCKRIVLFNLIKDPLNENEFIIEFRHYGISMRQRDVNRGIKKLLNSKKLPDMSKFNDLADYIMRNGKKNGSQGGFSSESEMDDLPESRIILPEDYQDKKKNTSVAIKLHELGPRLQLKLVKIEEGFCRGNVVFHQYVKLDKSEIKKQMDSLKSKRELKEQRKKQQEQNVLNKLKKKQQKNGEFQEEEQENKKGQDEYVSDVEEADFDEGVAPGSKSIKRSSSAPQKPNKQLIKNKRSLSEASDENQKNKVFNNFQKKGLVPNITSVIKRPAGISKGLWKKERQSQLTGEVQTKRIRTKSAKRNEIKDQQSKQGRNLLGKRTFNKSIDKGRKTATTHKSNTSTFKSQTKKRQKKSD